ncbi:MAG: hypothetical protein KAT43_06415 [Nanoarchaeota archaeon]|nr:hypothetical protein [Nanoarchaeota archaeon]
MMYTHKTWEPEFDLDTEDGLVSELLLLSAEYHNAKAYQAPTGESTPRPFRAKNGYDVEGFLKAALGGERIAMPIPGACFLLHTKDFSEAVGSWGSDREIGEKTCIHRVDKAHELIAAGQSIPRCRDINHTCYCGNKCEAEDSHYENRRFGTDIPRPLSEIVEYVVSGKAGEDRAKALEEAEE